MSLCMCIAEKLLEEILARVEDGELPDAAETEVQWSSFITTATQSTKLQAGDFSEGEISSDKTSKNNKIPRTDSMQRTKGHSVTGKETCPSQRKRHLAPVDEGKMFQLALYLQVTRKMVE